MVSNNCSHHSTKLTITGANLPLNKVLIWPSQNSWARLAQLKRAKISNLQIHWWTKQSAPIKAEIKGLKWHNRCSLHNVSECRQAKLLLQRLNTFFHPLPQRLLMQPLSTSTLSSKCRHKHKAHTLYPHCHLHPQTNLQWFFSNSNNSNLCKVRASLEFLINTLKITLTALIKYKTLTTGHKHSLTFCHRCSVFHGSINRHKWC